MTPKQEAALRQAREALKESHPEAYRHTIAAIDEALAEQQSGIKQVIDLYDSPEQPAQQDYWQEEARRYAQNAEFWRGKYETATAQQQEPVAAWENKYGMKEWQVHALRAEWSPPASKPWVGLTEEEVDECYYWKGRQWTTDELVRHVEAKLREKNA